MKINYENIKLYYYLLKLSNNFYRGDIIKIYYYLFIYLNCQINFTEINKQKCMHYYNIIIPTNG